MSAAAQGGVPVVEIPFERFTLSCGATLLVHRREGAPVTAARLHVRGGPRFDPAGRTGVAYYTGAFADQGTSTRDSEAIASMLEPEGGGVSGDALGLTGAIIGPSWGLLLDVMGELAADAAYPADRIDLHLGRMKTRLAVEAEDPRAQGGIRFKRLVYGSDHFKGRSLYGDLESVERITAADLVAHREANWCGQRMVLAVAGDVDPAAIFERADRAFGGVPVGTAYERVDPELPPIEPRRDAFVRDRNQVHVHLGHLGVTRDDPDYAALAVMDHVLGTGPGFTNRITARLRDELGLAYAVHADIHGSAGLMRGVFRAYIGTSPEHVRTAIDGFLTEMRRIQDEPVPAEELEVAKSYLVGSFALGYERVARRAAYLIASELHGFPADHLARVPAEYAAVTPEDVQRAARAHLHPDACSIVTSGPEIDLG